MVSVFGRLFAFGATNFVRVRAAWSSASGSVSCIKGNVLVHGGMWSRSAMRYVYAQSGVMRSARDMLLLALRALRHGLHRYLDLRVHRAVDVAQALQLVSLGVVDEHLRPTGMHGTRLSTIDYRLSTVDCRLSTID